MPTHEKILGFGNPWYEDAIKAANFFLLNNGLTVWIISAPYFIGTKLSAYARRGNNDFYSSHDIEDIIAVIDGRATLISELASAPLTLRTYIANEFKKFLNDSDFMNALPGHIIGPSLGTLRLPVVLERINTIASLQNQGKS